MDEQSYEPLVTEKRRQSIRISLQPVTSTEERTYRLRRQDGILEERWPRRNDRPYGIPGQLIPYVAYIAVSVLLIWGVFHVWCTNDLGTFFYRMAFSKTAVAPGIHLRILPLGDSITAGIGSSDGNGYRKMLQEYLEESGSSFDFIGNLTSGEHDEYYHEGWGGRQIHEITLNAFRDGSFRKHPNVILLHAGTNDLQIINAPYASAPDRLGNLLDGILCECPDAVVLVARIIWHQAGDIIPRLEAYNSAMREIVMERAAKGYRVDLIDQSLIGGADLWDGLHPNDVGYKKMAQHWFHALQDAPQNWFTAPREPALEYDQRTCFLEEAFWGRLQEDGEPEQGAVEVKLHLSRDTGAP